MKNIPTKQWCRLLITFALLLVSCQSADRTPSKLESIPAPDSLNPISQKIEQLVMEGSIPSITVAVVRDGKILWEQAFGYADQEHENPATIHTPYPLASLSKPLTASGLMTLVEEGRINLDRPANHYLDDAGLTAHVGSTDEATLRRIANHTAGLPLHAQHFYTGTGFTPIHMNETISRYGNLISVPGERFQYSNLGYGILGYIIARMTNQNAPHATVYANYMQQRVFSPLGMHHTFVYTGTVLPKECAKKYTPEGEIVPPYVTDSPGASAIYSSVHDMVRFAIFQLKNNPPDQVAILSEKAIDEMQTPGTETTPTKDWESEGSGYGLGWHVGITKDRMRIVYHHGGTLGISTSIALVPEENLAVVVLSNTNSEWTDVILIQTLCTLLNRNAADFLPQQESNANDAPPELPQQYTGQWQGFVHTYEGDVPLKLAIQDAQHITTTLGKQFGERPGHQTASILQEVTYEETEPIFNNYGGGPYLRGWLQGELDTLDVQRGQPNKLWLELKLRDHALTGALVAFSQKTFYSGPISHWVMLEKVVPALESSHH